MFWGTCDKFLIQNPANTIVEIDQYYILKGMDRDHPFKREGIPREARKF